MSDKQSEFDKFKELAEKLLAVPRSEAREEAPKKPKASDGKKKRKKAGKSSKKDSG